MASSALIPISPTVAGQQQRGKGVKISIPGVERPVGFSAITHNSLIQYHKQIQEIQARNEDFRTKLRAIDLAYYCVQNNIATEEDVKKCLEDVGVIFEAPIVVSQVDSTIAFLSEVFLSEYPLFEIAGPPDEQKAAEGLEAIIDDHAIRGRYHDQFIHAFTNLTKYNFGAIEAVWSTIGQIKIDVPQNTPLQQGSPRPQIEGERINRIFSLDPYNMFWDQSVEPKEIGEFGEYVGYNRVYSRARLRGLIENLRANEENLFNVDKIFSPGTVRTADHAGEFYHVRPQVSKYVNARDSATGLIDWISFALNKPSKQEVTIDFNNSFLISFFYARIIPEDYGLNDPNPKVPSMWYFIVVNNQFIIHTKKVISPFGHFPIIVGQLHDDGFELQTKSVAERHLVIQDVVSELINTRLTSARRAISDRALFDATLISPSDVNSPVPAAKIPVKGANLREKDTLERAYKSIPFDDAGTASAMGDASRMLQLAEFLSNNSARQGQFKKGNRTLGEFDEIMSFSDMRARLWALSVEYKMFVPLKEMLKLNIFLFAEKQDLISTATGRLVTVDPAALREILLAFKVSDGFTPKSKVASADVFAQLFQAMATIPQLATTFNIPKAYVHLSSTQGVDGMDQFIFTPEERGAEEQRQVALQQQQAAANSGPAQPPR